MKLSVTLKSLNSQLFEWRPYHIFVLSWLLALPCVGALVVGAIVGEVGDVGEPGPGPAPTPVPAPAPAMAKALFVSVVVESTTAAVGGAGSGERDGRVAAARLRERERERPRTREEMAPKKDCSVGEEGARCGVSPEETVRVEEEEKVREGAVGTKPASLAGHMAMTL